MKATDLLQQWFDRARRKAGFHNDEARALWLTAKQRSFIISLVQREDHTHPCYNDQNLLTINGWESILSRTMPNGCSVLTFRNRNFKES